MSTKSLSINSASGADSTQAQEQAVKSFRSSSSNLNNASEREQSSSLELPSESIKSVANNVEVDDEVEEFDLSLYALKGFNGNPAVYVGTYGKYAQNSLRGVWLDLTTFADYDEFLAVCRYIYRDEADPEFMAQDFEGFPREWYTEGFMSEREFDLIREFAELDNDEREAFEVYVAAFGSSRDDVSIFDNLNKCGCVSAISEQAPHYFRLAHIFREAYCGKWSSEEEYAEQLVDDCCMLEGAPEFLKSYFNYAAFARDLFIDDYYFDSGFVFRRM